MARHLCLPVVAGILAAAISGCIEREEWITISADGSVSVVHVLKGDVQDLKGGAAALPFDGFKVDTFPLDGTELRWKAVARLKKLDHPQMNALLPDLIRFLKDPKGDPKADNALFAKLKAIDDPGVKRELDSLWKILKKPAAKRPAKYGYKAAAEYRSVLGMPGTFATGVAKMPEQALRWRDRLESREAGGKTRQTFTRTYEARSWGPFAFGERRFVAGVAADLPRWAGLSKDRKLEVARSLLAWENFKHEVFVAAAIRELAPEHGLRVEATLAVRKALAARALTGEEILRVLRLPEKQLKEKAASIVAWVESAALGAAIRALGLDDAEAERLKAAYDQARRDFEVTDDLSDESFVVHLTLPGKVLTHNGDEVKGRTVTWWFDGKDLRDRSHRLAVVWETE